MKTLFKNADVLLRKDNNYDVLEGAFVGINGDTIDYIGTQLPTEKYDIEKDMNGKLLMPGLYNNHTHSAMTLLRGIGSDLPLNEWLFDTIFPIEDKLDNHKVGVGCELAMLEMLAGGTVSFTDMYFFLDDQFEKIIKSGIKANICRPVQCFDPTETPENSFRIKESLDYFNKYNNTADGRMLVDFSIHAEYTVTENIAKYYIEKCNEHNGNMHIHVSETKKEHLECIERHGVTPTQWLYKLGAFESSLNMAHCVAIDEKDMEIIRTHNATVSHNPTSNMKLGSGFAKVPQMLEAGINVTLGTDGTASNNNLNMFEEMHMASVIHKGFNQDAGIVKTDEIIKMATLNGAKSQRRENCGEIKVGCKADIIAINLDKPHLIPALDKKALIVYSAQDSDVCMTMVDGKILYENGEYMTLDKERIYYDVNKAVSELYR